MLTRLRVTGFKNLVDVDVRFGPFTCIAGPNGVGKSNLFDAIRFLSALADKPFVDAAKCVRDESRRTGEVAALFHQRGGQPIDRMRFVAEMIVPERGVDQLGLSVEARTTFLRYTLDLGLVRGGPEQLGDQIELLNEELTYVKSAEFAKALPFLRSDEWMQSAVIVKEVRRAEYISTGVDKQTGLLSAYMHADGNTHKKAARPAKQLKKTLLSAATSLESPTASLARQEMLSWRLLQLEPSSLRAPDRFDADQQIGADGSHLPATLYRLTTAARASDNSGGGDDVSAGVALRLQQLIRDIRQIDVERSETERHLTLYATDRQGVRLPARSLSDGTLRFLALSVLEEDERAVGVLCFEEPENGIHPERIPAMLRLLQDIAVSTEQAVGSDNPLRQVIVNTHSPLVLTGVPEDTLLGAKLEEYSIPAGLTRRVNYLPMDGTWRSRVKPKPRVMPLGDLLAYLEPPVARAAPPSSAPANGHTKLPAKPTLVRDRKDVQLLLFDDPEAA